MTLKSLFGRHIETKYVKTKKEGRNFGLNVELNADGFLRKYLGNDDPDNLYGDTDVPGKVTGYRFKTFYLVPDKSHFRTFFNKVVSPKWLQSDHPNAVALRAARGNINHVWRVMHRVTYVSRVPPSGNKPVTSSEKPTRAVIHKTPNRAIINLVLDTIREKVTSTGEALPGSNADDPKRIAAAVADVIDHQLAFSIPWWQGYLDRARAEPGSARFNELKRLKHAVFEYMLAYFVTGDGQEDERLKNPPEGSAKGNGDAG